MDALNYTEFLAGRDFKAQKKLGAHLAVEHGTPGAWFAVWAPHAQRAAVIGDFNAWRPDAPHAPLALESGVWRGFIPGVQPGHKYKYHLTAGAYAADKADPFGCFHETPPQTASIVWDLAYAWGDGDWMLQRHRRHQPTAPLAIYEVHLGSWQPGRTYRALAPKLVGYVKELGFTHVEFLPVMEHPFYGSWGYQTTGYFAPTSRYGTPQDFMFLIDTLHQNGIGVILDWVPSHFPTDAHGLSYFDGTHLFEHADPRQGFHPDWHSAIFNYGRPEVRSFLFSSALFWLEQYHADGLRVDAVASMLQLDYSRQPGEWVPNELGGRENLEAIQFLKELNLELSQRHPDALTIAEESTAWPKVSRPLNQGGLGFGLKWDMGWMFDTLRYLKREPARRPQHQAELTFRRMYAFNENYVLPLSHDEVAPGKGSLLGQMPGDDSQKAAGLRLLLGYMYAQPGKKLLFMGGEFAQPAAWHHDAPLQWDLAAQPRHAGMARWVADLNRLYRADPALHELDFDPQGFEWIEWRDEQNCVLSFLRKGRDPARPPIVAVFNFLPRLHPEYRLGVPCDSAWRELLNSDASRYGGAGTHNPDRFPADRQTWNHRPCSLRLTLPPLSALFLSPSL